MRQVTIKYQNSGHLVDLRPAARARDALRDHQFVGLDAGQTFIPEDQRDRNRALQRPAEALDALRLRADITVQRQRQADENGIRLLLGDDGRRRRHIAFEAADALERPDREGGGF